MQALLQKLNWRLMLLHFLAMWLFTYAFKTVGIVYDYDFFRFIKEHYHQNQSDNFLKALANAYPGRTAARLALDVALDNLRVQLLRTTGLLSAFLVSLAITIRMRWFWPNSLIAFLAAIAVYEYYETIPDYLSPTFYISYFPLKLDSVWGLVIAGGISLVVGLWLFFSKKVMRFISRGQHIG
jgi:hypothetical protein